MPNYKVEIGFDELTELGNLFKLDDTTRGRLDNTTYTLGGGGFWVDVSEHLKSIQINRGRSRQLDRYTSGQATIIFNNHQRQFDPTYTLSPYYGEIVPRRNVRISVDGIYLYTGIIEDWNLNYDPNGDSIAEARASDAFTVLAKQILEPVANTAQLSGARVNAILDNSQVYWSQSDRNIDSGFTRLGGDTIASGTNALSYLQQVEESEPGNLFIDALGRITYKDRNTFRRITDVLLADDGTGISYGNVQVTYGSELLYNEVTATSSILAQSTTVSDTTSQTKYGILSYDSGDLLIEQAYDLTSYAGYLLRQFKDPELRIDSVEIDLKKQDDSTVSTLLELDLSDVIQIKFTPNGISPAIQEYVQISALDNDISVDRHILRIGLASILNFDLVLDSTLFGRLDTGTLAW